MRYEPLDKFKLNTSEPCIHSMAKHFKQGMVGKLTLNGTETENDFF